jgi:ABC-type uncharacterized transport system substrate-binding protein
MLDKLKVDFDHVSGRRSFLLLGAAVLATPAWAFAQQQRTWRIGQLSVISRSSYLESGRHEAFLKALRDLGYVEGRNLTLEERYADGKTERLPALADELVAAKVDMIVTIGTNAGLAAKARYQHGSDRHGSCFRSARGVVNRRSIANGCSTGRGD